MEWEYRAALLAILGPVLAISIYHRRRARVLTDQIPRRAEGPVPVLILFRLFVGLPTWLAVFVYLIQPRWMAWSHVDLPSWLRWAGAGFGALMIPFGHWIFTSLGTNVSETVLTKEGQTLVTRGPYHWVRHPLYAAGGLWAVALSVLTANWFLGLMSLVALLVLPAVASREEAHLLERFGSDYADYMNRTGRFLPRSLPRQRREEAKPRG